MPNIYADIALSMLNLLKVPITLGLSLFAVKFAVLLGYRAFKRTLFEGLNNGDMFAVPNPRRNPNNWFGSTYIGPRR